MDLWVLLYIFFNTLIMYLFANSKLLQYLGECLSKMETRVQMRNLNQIKKHSNWYAIVFKMDHHSNIGLIVRWRPGIGCKVKGIFILLNIGKYQVPAIKQLIISPEA